MPYRHLNSTIKEVISTTKDETYSLSHYGVKKLHVDLIYSYISLRSFSIEDTELPEDASINKEYLLRLFKSFNGGDISFIFADVYEDDAYLDYDSATSVKSRTKI